MQDIGHDSNDFLVIRLWTVQCSYRARTRRQPHYAAAASPSKDPVNYTSFPSFVFNLEFPNLDVIKLLRESLWTPSKTPNCSPLSLNAPVCCRPSATVHLFSRVGPRQPTKTAVQGLGSSPRGVSSVDLLLQEVIHDGALLKAPRFLLRIYHGLFSAQMLPSQDHRRDILNFVSRLELPRHCVWKCGK